MDGFIGQFLASIPTAAASPLAFVAYLATLIAWALIVNRVRTLKGIGQLIQQLPEKDRIPTLTAALGTVRVGEFTPEEYIKHQVNRYIFISFLVACATFIVVAGLAARDALNREQLTEEMIDEFFLEPSSQYMSAVNVLNSGPNKISHLASAMPPSPSMGDLENQIAILQSQGLSPEEIANRLRSESKGGKLQIINENLLRASARIEHTFSNIAECFRDQKCINAAKNMTIICKNAIRVTTDAKNSNLEALSVPGVIFIKANSVPIFGEGALDRIFREIKLPNAQFILSKCEP